MIKYPTASRGHVRRCTRFVEFAVHVKANDVRLPLYGENVKVVGKATGRQRVRATEWVSSRVAGTVEGTVYFRRLETDVLHDVDLAARRPSNSGDVVAQHPKGRPDALSVRNLYTCLKSPVPLCEEASRLQAC